MAKKIVERVNGKRTKRKILEFLHENVHMAYTINEIAGAVDVSYSNAYYHIKTLVKKGVQEERDEVDARVWWYSIISHGIPGKA